jgi:hypothetical protein
MKTTTNSNFKKHYFILCFFIVMLSFSQSFTTQNQTICGENNVISIDIEGFTNFQYSSTAPISAFTDSNCTMPYVAQLTNTIYLKIDISQLDSSTFPINLSAKSSNGTTVNQEAIITNNTKVWKGNESANWNDSNNWMPSGVPTASNCVIVPSIVTIAGTDYNAYAKNIVIKPTGSLEIQASNNLTLNDQINVNTGGIFNVKNNASLIQINENKNLGIVNIEKITQPMSYYDYTYWNSPLTADSNFTLNNLSPLTKTDFWSYSPTISGGSGNWSSESTSSIMIPNKGYIVKAPDTFSTNSNSKKTYTANFIGTPNNGTVLAPISKGTNANISKYILDDDDEWNLIGNPYPSGIDAKKFLEYPANANVIEGTIYIWTHNPQPTAAYQDQYYGDYVLNYTSDDYASFNKTGSTGTASSATNGTSIPSGYIASGNSFFVKAAKSLTNGTTANVTFNNSMRITEKNDDLNNSINGTKKIVTEEKNRIWLNLTNNSGAFSQTLIGYVTGATQELDRGFDGESFGGNDVTFYSILPDTKLAIQGRALPFDQNDVVTLGYKAAKKGNYSIRIDHLDGVFDNQSILLEDKVLNIIYDLKANPYVFSTAVGEFNNRFAIRYTQKSLSVNENTIADNSILVSYGKNDNTLNLNNTLADVDIQNVNVFNILGQSIKSWKIQNQEQTNINLPITNMTAGIYIVKVKTSQGEINKKIVFN